MRLFQVGAGSGGMVVLDLLARDATITHATLIDPDIYRAHNVYRHVFPPSGVGRTKVDLAAEWLRERRPYLSITPLAADLTDAARLAEFEQFAGDCDIGICAVDNEPAKYAFDALMRRVGKPWTLGEVLSGGIGGWVHRFVPGGPCYGCVASYLQRTVADEPAGPAPDYSNPGSAVRETTVPASKASIEVIASLHAVVTLEFARGLDEPGSAAHSTGFTSMLFTLRKVPGVFEEAYRTHRFLIPRSPNCLVCSNDKAPVPGEALDVAVDQALGRLAAE
jgi:molybdopterin/thiamine biosynthesis adenylyltransferase